MPWVDKVTAETSNVISAIANFVFSVAEEVTEFSDQVKIRFYSQLVEAELSSSKKESYYLLQWKPFKTDEKCFVCEKFLKALFVLKIFKFFSWLFGDLEEMV